jgi:tRNA threonylcarbamoyladenosine biosynthesis protein TsaE
MKSWVSRSEEETREIARGIARLLPSDAVVELRGDLGAGKTTMVKAIAEELGADPLEVSSPSFALVHEYPVPSGPPIVHIDGYRLSDRPHEWEEIGVFELLRAQGLKFVEWPKKGFGKSDWVISISVREDDSRSIELAESAR